MPKKRDNALKDLQQSMNVQNDLRTNVITSSDDEPKETAQVQKPRSRVVNNIPWYPKSAALKKELKLLALHEDTTLTGLIDEGITMVLEKRGKNIKDYL